MRHANLFRAWGRILSGSTPTLSIEITRECPLRCPGCYAYEPQHLGTAGPLRDLSDYKGEELVEGILALVRHHRPVYISLVGGEPLVRYRELDALLPKLSAMGVAVQLVTSAVRPIPAHWRGIKGFWPVVSIDGLQPEHDRRRAPATYERILKHIEGHSLTVHCTVTSQMARRPGSFPQFLEFWSARPEIWQIWFSLFTPQKGERSEEILTPVDRARVLDELSSLRPSFPKLTLPDAVIEGYRRPPASPAECIFARTTMNYSADLKTRIAPCQFGGDPDCKQCGCMASAGIHNLSQQRLLGIARVRTLYEASDRIGRLVARRSAQAPRIQRGA